MYPLDRGMWGPTVRIGHLRDELSRLADLDVIAAYRPARRVALARYAASGRLRRLDGVYVETSSFLPAETDVAFLGLARALGIPVLTYIRDAYQLFDDYGSPTTLRGRIARTAFRPSARALRAVSTRVAFPTRGLADAVFGSEADALLLPPGSPAPVDVPPRPDADRLLFVGDARLPAQGADRLIAAVARARERGSRLELEIACRPGQEPAGPDEAWVHLVRAEGQRIVERLPGIVATVIPRPRNAYNDLALPIKLYDYLSYARPLVVTDCTEQAAVVREAACGLVVADDADAIAAGIETVAAASPAEAEGWSANARAAAVAASWAHRARQIVAELSRP